MPKIEDIEKFKTILNELGSEPEIRAERDEEIEDISPPKDGLSADLTNLLGISEEKKELDTEKTEDTGVPTAETESKEPTGEDFFKADDILGFELPDMAGIAEEPPSDQAPPEEEKKEEPPVDLDALTGIEPTDISPEQPVTEEPLPEQPTTEEPVPDETKMETAEELDDISGFELPDIGDITAPGVTPPEEPTEKPLDQAVEPPKEEKPPEEPTEPVDQEQPTPEPEAEEEFSEEDFTIDEFALPDIGEDFGITKEEVAKKELEITPEVESGVKIEVPDELAKAEEDIEISKKDFEFIQQTLASLPRNLKILVEELIGENKVAGPNLKKLLALLIGGEAPKEIAALVGEITGKKIVIPKSFQKKTGLAFEKEIATFDYLFRKKILPKLLYGTAAALIIILILLGIQQFIVKPLTALKYYNDGYNFIIKEDFDYLEANRNFQLGVNEWFFKDQFYRYAEAFAEKGEYGLAEEKYKQLLGYTNLKFDEKARVDYGRLLTRQQKFEESESVLKEFLDQSQYMYDYNALLARGDNFLEWAADNPGYYQEAKYNYDFLKERYGQQKEIMLRLLRYNIRVDDPVNVEAYKDYFQANKNIEIDPYIYAELAAYQLDRNELGEIQDILDRAKRVKDDLPQIHYQYARYFRKIEEPQKELDALQYTLGLLDRENINPENISEWEAIRIDTHNRLGELYNMQDNPMQAMVELNQAISRYEAARTNNILTTDEKFGKIYANLADIYYETRVNPQRALQLYELAEQNLYINPHVNYKKGVINYEASRFDDAVLEFHIASEKFPENHNVIYAKANALYKSGKYFTAQGNYIYLLNLLLEERQRITFLRPEQNPQHRALMEKLMIINNNLGVTLVRLTENYAEQNKYQDALTRLTNSAEIYNILSRDPETMALSPTAKALLSIQVANGNMDSIFHPEKGKPLIIYELLPKNMESDRFSDFY